MATRRQILIAGGAAAALVGAVQLGPRLARRLSGPDFEPYGPVEGFRRIAGGDVSAPAFDPFAGLSGRAEIAPDVLAAVRGDLCGALFPEAGEGVPAAYFTDHYCPYCRVLSDLLARVGPEEGLDLHHHFTPLFGRASDLAARAVVAARAQGGFAALNTRLTQTRISVTPASLAEIARAEGLDPARLARDMEGGAVEAALARDRALARIFAFPGTPALVVGGTVVIGRIEAPTLRDVIAAERGRALPC